MKRACVSAVVLAACASGRNPSAGDASDPRIDAKLFLDGKIEQTDARPLDAPPIDAAVDARPDAPPDACVPHTSQLLANPAFDMSPMGTSWNQTPINAAYPDVTDRNGGLSPHSPPNIVWMGGYSGSDFSTTTVTDVVYQDVAVPAGTTQLILSGYYVAGTYESPNNAVYDTANIDLLQTNGTPIEAVLALTNLTTTGLTWTAFSHTFAANVSGTTVRVRLTTSNDFSGATTFLFDTLSLQAKHCP